MLPSLFLRVVQRGSNPEKFRFSEIYSQVSAIAAYRFARIKALTGVLRPVIRETPNESAVFKIQNQKFF